MRPYKHQLGSLKQILKCPSIGLTWDNRRKLLYNSVRSKLNGIIGSYKIPPELKSELVRTTLYIRVISWTHELPAIRQFYTKLLEKKIDSLSPAEKDLYEQVLHEISGVLVKQEESWFARFKMQTPLS